MTTMRDYYRPVVNQAGYILEFPNIGDAGDLLQSYPPNPYAQSISQLFPLGTKLTQGEKIWRYCKNGAGTPAAGGALQQAITINAAACLDIVVDATTAIGATTISITSQAAIACAADYYKEGWAIPNVGTGVGHVYKIKTHTALVTTTAGTIVTLYDPLITASTAGTTKWGLRKNPYDMVIDTAAVLTGIPVGIAPILLTASYYFWAQTGGPAACIVNAALVTGKYAVVGTTAAKVDPAGVTTTADQSVLQIIGWAMMTADTQNEAGLVFLTLDR